MNFSDVSFQNRKFVHEVGSIFVLQSFMVFLVNLVTFYGYGQWSRGAKDLNKHIYLFKTETFLVG